MGNITKNYYDHSQSHDIEINTPMTVDEILELQRKNALQQYAEDAVVLESASAQQQRFAFMKHCGHSEEELEAAMESLKIRCQGRNSRELVRFLNDLDKEGFIDISGVRGGELYDELCKSFGIPNIQRTAFTESYRLIG